MLDFVGIWKDTLRHLRLDVRMLDPKPEEGTENNSELQQGGDEHLRQSNLLEHHVSGYSLKAFYWLEGGSETKQPSLEWIEGFLGSSYGMLQVFCCPTLPANILDRILARHASTLVVLHTSKGCLEVIKKYIPAMSGLEELYFSGTLDEEVRSLVPLAAGDLPRLRILWMEEVDRELRTKEILLDLATAMHVEILATTTSKWSIRGWRDPTSAKEPKLMWGKDAAMVRVP